MISQERREGRYVYGPEHTLARLCFALLYLRYNMLQNYNVLHNLLESCYLVSLLRPPFERLQLMRRPDTNFGSHRLDHNFVQVVASSSICSVAFINRDVLLRCSQLSHLSNLPSRLHRHHLIRHHLRTGFTQLSPGCELLFCHLRYALKHF